MNSKFILNEKKTYEFIFDKPSNLDGINIYFAPVNNLSLKVYKINYFSDGQEYSIEPNDFSITSNHSLIIDENNGIFQVFLTKLNEELLKFRHKSFKNVEKMNISMHLKKMNLTNKSLCKIN